MSCDVSIKGQDGCYLISVLSLCRYLTSADQPVGKIVSVQDNKVRGTKFVCQQNKDDIFMDI